MCWRRVFRTRSSICLCLIALIGGLYVVYSIARVLNVAGKLSKEDGMLFYSIQEVTKKPKNQRIVLIGAGPTSLGALHRLNDLGVINMNHIQIILLEQKLEPGGLASSTRDNKSFLWDNGGHVVFSHYKYFDAALDKAVDEWNYKKRASFAHMMGGDGERRFVPYPVQNNIHLMDKKHQNISLRGLEEEARKHSEDVVGMRKFATFKEWLIGTFGTGLCDIFMFKYNKKVWTVDASQMNSVWVGERVAVPDIESIKSKIAKTKDEVLEDEAWGPNHFFRFPKYGGTGGVWKAVAGQLPQGWFHYGHKVTEISLENKQLRVELGNGNYYVLSYDVLITTAPLDILVEMISDYNEEARSMKDLTRKLLYSRTHVIGIGLLGEPPVFLQHKSWIYFPDSDAPFYRATVFSSYADDNVPSGWTDIYWSLMCEVAEPKTATNKSYWTETNLIEETVKALHRYQYIGGSKIVSKYYNRLDHGYPIPTVDREEILSVVQPWLRSHSVYSRGRFGGWRYEVGNQDHSFMQGVEIADYILSNVKEETYPDPERVNSMKLSNRSVQQETLVKPKMDYEIVISHKVEDLSWLAEYSQHVHVYHRGARSSSMPNFRFQMWSNIAQLSTSTETESFTFLYHIVTNYHYLADVTIFLEGNGCHKHIIKQSHKSHDINNYLAEARRTGISFKNLKTSTIWEKIDMDEILTSNTHSLNEYWTLYFSELHQRPPEMITWSKDSCFAVNRNRILRKPRIFYENLLQSLTGSINPAIEGRYLKRLWYTMFNS